MFVRRNPKLAVVAPPGPLQVGLVTNSRQLLALALLAEVHGIGFLFHLVPLSPAQDGLPNWLLTGYSIGWLAAGTWSLLCATLFRNRRRRRHWARYYIALAMVVWSSVYFVGFFWYHSHFAWFGCVLYLLLAWATADPPPLWWKVRRKKAGP